MARGPLAFALVASLAACSSSGDAPVAPPVTPTADAGEAAPTGACPAGQARLSASGACEPGPWSTCAPGLRPAPSGWGCVDALGSKCTGATREDVTTGLCAPIGDCDAPFPPAGAIVVDPQTPVVDATHKRTIGDAIAAAGAGDTIAVEAGSYPENLTVTRGARIVGRCAARVTLASTGLAAQGIRVTGGALALSGVTLRGHRTVALSVGPGASADVSDAVFEDNGMVAISLSDGAATVKVTRSVIRGTRESSVSGEGGWGINAQQGSRVEMTDVALSDNRSSAVRLSSDAVATLTGIVARGTRRNSAYDFGRGVTVIRGAKATLERSVVFDNSELGVVVGDGGELDMKDVVVRDTVPSEEGRFGRGLNLFGAARVGAERVFFHRNRDATVMVAEEGSRLTLSSSVVADTALDETGHVGRGVTVQEGASLTMTGTAIAGSHEVALAVFSKGTVARVERSTLVSTKPNLGPAFGHGVMATDDGRVELAGVEIAGNYGIGVAVGPASALLSGARVYANAVGLFVQDGTSLREVSASPPAPGDREVVVTADSELSGNGSRVTSGVVPLPEPILGK